jgi:hypothetical protein
MSVGAPLRLLEAVAGEPARLITVNGDFSQFYFKYSIPPNR